MPAIDPLSWRYLAGVAEYKRLWLERHLLRFSRFGLRLARFALLNCAVAGVRLRDAVDGALYLVAIERRAVVSIPLQHLLEHGVGAQPLAKQPASFGSCLMVAVALGFAGVFDVKRQSSIHRPRRWFVKRLNLAQVCSAKFWQAAPPHVNIRIVVARINVSAFVDAPWRNHAAALAPQIDAQVWVHAIAHWVVRIDLVVEVFAFTGRDAPWRVGQVLSNEFDGVIAVRIDNDDLLASDNRVVVVRVVGAIQPVFLLPFWRLFGLPGLPLDDWSLLDRMRRHDREALFCEITRRLSHPFACIHRLSHSLRC